MTDKLRAEAKRVLREGIAEMVIGWAEGSAEFKTTPFFAFTEEDCDRLVWNTACVNNLAKPLDALLGKVLGSAGEYLRHRPCLRRRHRPH